MANADKEKNREIEFVVNGYSFETQEEYEKALEEKKSIERLMKKVNLNKGELLVALYSGLITQNKLSTVIGLEYLCRLRDIIINKNMPGHRSCHRYRQLILKLSVLWDISLPILLRNCRRSGSRH